MGSIYKRGKIYWIKYYRNGKPYRESTKSVKEADAKRLLKKREGEISGGKLPGIYFDRVTFDELAEDFKVDRAPYIPMLEENNVKEGFLESEEYLKLLSALPSYLRLMLTFGYRTGWRVQEVANLTWDRVDLEERIALIVETKNKEARAIYLDDQLLKLLKIQQIKAPKQCDYVFFNPEGGKINDIRFSWNQACREVSLGYGYRLNKEYVKKWEEEGLIAGPTFHDLRRTAARNLVRSGVDRDVAKRITGHKTDSIFSRYNIVSANDLKEAAIKQDAYLNGHNYGHSRSFWRNW